MDVFGKVILVVFVAFIIVFLPTSYTAKKGDAMDQILVQSETKKFCDDIRTKGYLTEERYLSFLSELDRTDNLYEVNMEHSHIITDPKINENGEVMGYEEYGVSTYEDEIRTMIKDGKKVYRMAKGDSFSVTVKNRTDTYGDAFDKLFYGMKPSEITIFATAGGVIREEVLGESP